jgi:hypothetical protein
MRDEPDRSGRLPQRLCAGPAVRALSRSLVQTGEVRGAARKGGLPSTIPSNSFASVRRWRRPRTSGRRSAWSSEEAVGVSWIRASTSSRQAAPRATERASRRAARDRCRSSWGAMDAQNLLRGRGLAEARQRIPLRRLWRRGQHGRRCQARPARLRGSCIVAGRHRSRLPFVPRSRVRSGRQRLPSVAASGRPSSRAR